jgi:hypothetical protein
MMCAGFIEAQMMNGWSEEDCCADSLLVVSKGEEEDGREAMISNEMGLCSGGFALCAGK